MIKPLGDRVLVQPGVKEETTPGGIIIPDKNDGNEKPGVGTIIEIGPKVDLVEKGQQIIHQAYAGTFVTVDGEKMLMLKQDDILGVLSE